MHMSKDHLAGHGHTHEDQTPMRWEELIVLLSYMLDHNRQHTEELHGLFHTLDDAGCYDAADELETAMRYYNSGNDALENALDLAKQFEGSESK